MSTAPRDRGHQLALDHVPLRLLRYLRATAKLEQRPIRVIALRVLAKGIEAERAFAGPEGAVE